MSPATSPPTDTGLLTYEAYMEEEEFTGRYDIIEGVRYLMSSPTWNHQTIMLNIYVAFRMSEEPGGIGKAQAAPFDVLIRRRPRLQVRQPDVLFISNEQLARGGGPPKKGPLEIAPELVVEVISNTERARDIETKTADYVSIGVREMWRVWPERRAVEVWRLDAGTPHMAASYDETQTIRSLAFPDLAVAVADVFEA